MKIVALIAALAGTVLLVGSAHADDKISLPLGSWDDVSNGASACKKPFLGIEPRQIIIRMERGFVNCPISKLHREISIIYGGFKCAWDKSIPQEYLIEGDGDPDGFSIRVLSRTKILYNNVHYQFCGPLAGGTQ